jgi:hypothetical protein
MPKGIERKLLNSGYKIISIDRSVNKMTTTVLAGVAGALLSLLFEYVPGIAGWFEKQTSITKRIVMSVALIVAAAVVYAMACAGLLGALNWSLTCDEAGLTQLLGVLFAALATNQTFHALVKKG